MKKSIYSDQNGFLEIMNKYDNHIITTNKHRKRKLIVKLKRQKVIIDYNANVLGVDYGCSICEPINFNFDEVTFNYCKNNPFQTIKLWEKGEAAKTLVFDEKDTVKVIYKDEFAFCNFNRNLEYLIARYRKLKGGE